MINKFLQARHWQLFSILAGLPMLLYIGFIYILLSNVNSSPVNDLEYYDSSLQEPSLAVFTILPVVMVIIMAVYTGWVWSIGAGLQKHIPAHLRLNVPKLKLAMSIQLIYVIVLGVGMVLLMTNSGVLVTFVSGSLILIPFGILHLLTIFCAIYGIYFAAKSIKLAELQRQITVGEYIGEFLLFWFYPLGVWFLQPMVNKLANGRETEFSDGLV